MYLVDVQLVPYTKDRDLAGRLMASWRHVEDILRAFLPLRWNVGGIGKLNVLLELDVPVSQECVMSSGFLEVRRKGFDAARFLALPEDAQDLESLSMLEEGLRVACARGGVVDEPARTAVLNTRETGFRHQWSWKKLAKWNPSRSLHAEVMVTYRRGGTDVALRITRRAGGLVVDDSIVTGQYWPSAWFTFFRSRWEGSEFVVFSRVGKEVLRRRSAA